MAVGDLAAVKRLALNDVICLKRLSKQRTEEGRIQRPFFLNGGPCLLVQGDKGQAPTRRWSSSEICKGHSRCALRFERQLTGKAAFAQVHSVRASGRRLGVDGKPAAPIVIKVVVWLREPYL